MTDHSTTHQEAPGSCQSRGIQILHKLPTQPEHPCAYLPNQLARDRGFSVSTLDPMIWYNLLENGWRRAGALIYEPACAMCNQCIPLRIPVKTFKPNRSQQRTIKRNVDIDIKIVPVQITDERAELYRKYITTRHNGMMTGSRNEFLRFLGITAVDTFEIEYRQNDTGKLLAVGTTDKTPRGWNCVYCYFDTQDKNRSLGTFNVLTTITLCKKLCPAGENSCVYLGYWVPESDTMAYKSTFKPCEIMQPDKTWHIL